MKICYINAYTSKNLGDDLFIKILLERYPLVKFRLFATKEYVSIFEKNTNLEVIYATLPYKIFNKIIRLFNNSYSYNWYKNKIISSCNCIVTIGGSIFIEDVNWEKQVRSYEVLMDIAKKNHSPVFFLGCNFGPYNNIEYYNKVKNIFKMAEDVSFREKYSYDLFKDLQNVRFSDDIVFDLKCKQSINAITKEIGISVIDITSRQDLKVFKNEYINKIIEIVQFYIKNNYKVTLFSFCKSQGDEEAINEIISKIKNTENLNTYFYNGDIDEALSALSSKESIVATRFHAMILGFILGKSVLPIVYSQKTRHVLNKIDFKGMSFDISNIKSLNVIDLYKNISKNKINVSEQVNNSKNHFLRLDEFL